MAESTTARPSAATFNTKLLDGAFLAFWADRRSLIMAVVLAACVIEMPASRAVAQQPSPLQAIDVFGSRQVTASEIEAIFGERLRLLALLHDRRDSAEYRELKDAMTREIEAMGDFAFVQVTDIELYTSDRPIYVTIDLVDADDADRRLDFRPEPGGAVEDPAGLLNDWRVYEARGGQLFRDGALGSFRVNAHHTLWGFDHPELAPLGDRFDREVPINEASLARVLSDSSNATDRAAAAYLLAHIENVDRLIELLVPSIRDPSPLVRNNAMRVLASVARSHPRVPLDPVIEALNFPAATDRNKALAIVRFLVESDDAKSQVIGRAGPTLLEMLKLNQPINRNLAHVVLERISGENYPAEDVDAWQHWLERQAP